MDFRTLPLFTSNLLLSDFITLRQIQNQPQEKPKPKEIILILGYQVKKVCNTAIRLHVPPIIK